MALISRLRSVGFLSLVWGLALSVFMCRGLLLRPHDEIHENHEGFSYQARLLEFRNVLATGNLSPQWCSDFRGGLGSPYFGYYQPGLFYLASMAPWDVPLSQSLGIVCCLLTLAGYWSMFDLVRRRFDALGGWLAGTALVLSPYACSNFYVRGDLSEYAGMMVVPVVLWSLSRFLEAGSWWPDENVMKTGTGTTTDCVLGNTRVQAVVEPVPVFISPGPWFFAGIAALSSCVVVTLHPCVSLVAYPLFVVWVVQLALEQRSPRALLRGLAVLAFGIAMSAFYWMPVLFEMHLVHGENAIAEPFDFGHHFVELVAIMGWQKTTGEEISCGLGWPILAMALANLSLLVANRKMWSGRQCSLVAFAEVATAVYVFLMLRASAPIWEAAPLLARLQFPWRALSVASMLVALLVGACPLYGRPRVRFVVAVVAVAAICFQAVKRTAYETEAAIVPQNIEELLDFDYAADVMNEWLPRGAKVMTLRHEDRNNIITPSGSGVRQLAFERGPSRLTCRLDAERPASILLPHYYFPTWTCQIDGKPAELKAGPSGLMLVSVPACHNATIEVTFHRTAMRTRGLWISAVSACIGLCLLIVMRHKAIVQTANGPST